MLGLAVFKSFKEAFSAYPTSVLGFPEGMPEQDKLRIIHRFYSPKEEKAKGVVCFQLRILD